MSAQVEAAERLVLRRLLALALQHVNRHRGLVVVGGGEHLGLLGGNGGVLLDQHAHDLAERLDAERERRHVEQQHVLDVAGEHGGLDGRADGHRLVGIDVAASLLVEESLDLLLHQGHARLAADKNHVVDFDVTPRPASLMAVRQGPMVRSTSSSTKDSSLARESLSTKCLGPL